jgi:hypothetical protein
VNEYGIAVKLYLENILAPVTPPKADSVSLGFKDWRTPCRRSLSHVTALPPANKPMPG